MKRAVNMPLNFLGTANDVFFRIFIIKDTKKRWRRKSDISLDDLSGKDPEFLVLTKFQTQTVRRAPHPEFNERFAAELKDLERRNSSLKLIAYVTDRFSQESTVGDVHVKLHRLEANSPKTFTLMLKETVHVRKGNNVLEERFYSILGHLELRRNSCQPDIFANS